MTEPLIQYKRLWTSVEPKVVELLLLHRNAGPAGRPTKFFAKSLGIPVSRVKSLAAAYPTLFELNGTRLAIADAARPYAHEFLTKLSRPCDIHFLFDYLDGLEPAQWRDLFPFIAVDQPAGERRWKQLLAIVQHIYDTPARVLEFVDKLSISDDHRAVFRLVYDSADGELSFDEIAASFDFHQSKLEHVLMELERYAVLFERYDTSSNAHPQRSYSLLKELTQFMVARRHSKKRAGRKPPVPLGRSPAMTVDEELNLAYGVSCLIAHLHTHMIRLTRDGAPHRTDLRKLVPLLRASETSRVEGEVICAVAVNAGLIEPDKDGHHLVLSDKAGPFAALDMLDRQKMLFDSMVRAQDGFHNIRNETVDLLSRIDAGAWYRLADVVKYARRQWLTDGQSLDAFRLRQSGPNWRYSLPPEKTDQLDSLKRYITKPLYLAGGIRLSLSENEPERVSLTPLGLNLMGLDGADLSSLSGATCEERGLIVQPNFQVVVDDVRFDPIHYTVLDTFCIRDGSGWATVFQLDKHSVSHGIQSMGSVEPFIEFLQRHNRHGDIPANVVSVLRGWDSGMKRVRIRRLGLIEADDDLVLMELLSRKKFRKYLDEDGKPKTFVVFNSISTRKLKQLLEDEGYFVE